MQMKFYPLIFRLKTLFGLLLERSRPHIFSFQGAKIGPKTRFGSGVRIDRNWCVTIGTRCQFEADVWLKLVSEEASLDIGDFSFLGRGVEIDGTRC